jgi:hypothetical protein
MIPILRASVVSSTESIIYFSQSSFTPIHVIIDKFKDLLILVVGSCTGMSNFGLIFIHDEETRIPSSHIVDNVWATNFMLITLLWNVIVIFWQDRATWYVWANYTRWWMHLSNCDHTVNWCRHWHSFHAFAGLEVIILLINHVRPIIFPEISIIRLALQSWHREVLWWSHTHYTALLIWLWCIFGCHFHSFNCCHLNPVRMNR